MVKSRTKNLDFNTNFWIKTILETPAVLYLILKSTNLYGNMYELIWTNGKILQNQDMVKETNGYQYHGVSINTFRSFKLLDIHTCRSKQVESNLE